VTIISLSSPILIVWPTIDGIMVDARDQVTIISLSSPILIFSNVSDKCLATNLFFTTIFFDNSFFFSPKKIYILLITVHIISPSPSSLKYGIISKDFGQSRHMPNMDTP
jgi:hypothetical protein